MKKIILLLCLLGSTGALFAQSARFGINAGLNLSTLSYSSSGQTNATSSLAGFHIGAFADFGLGAVSIQPGILYTTKGGKDDVSGTSTVGSSTLTYHATDQINLNYIEVPVNVLYHIPVVVGNIFIGGGPYVAMGVSGKEKTSDTYTQTGGSTASGSSASESNLSFGNSSGDIKNPDYGINLLGGIRLKSGLLFSAGYGFGLANLSNVSGSKTKNNGFSLSIGYSFL
jgi:hypothetical protein